MAKKSARPQGSSSKALVPAYNGHYPLSMLGVMRPPSQVPPQVSELKELGERKFSSAAQLRAFWEGWAKLFPFYSPDHHK